MLNAKRGEKKQGYLKVINSDYKIPITEIYGEKGDFTVVILGGIHPGEYVGVAAAMFLSETLDIKKIRGRIIIANPINISGFYAKVQHINPEDNKNCNRAFPGDKDGTITEKIGYTLANELFAEADFLLDLHGGDLHESLIPFAMYSTGCEKDVSEAGKNGANALGLNCISGIDFPQTTIGMAGKMGIPAVIAFVGGCGLVEKLEVKQYTDSVKNFLRQAGVYEGVPEIYNTAEFKSLNIFCANQTGCWYPEVKAGDRVEKGQLIGTIKNFFGETIDEYYAAEDANVLCVITSLAINKGDSIYELDR